MKILKLGDLHIGVKQDDKWIQNIQRDGIIQAIKLSKDLGITTWLQAGDFADTRKAITHRCMKFTREIADMIDDAGIEVHTIVGNHDLHYRDKMHPNFCSEYLTQFDNFIVYDKASTVDFDGVKIDMIPWICNENKDEIFEFIKKTKSKYCMGHFELNGFYFYKGLKSHGSEPDFLKKYKRVWSGHFHTISENRNVTYLGTPWSLTSGDENDPRGWWVFDTETEESTFYQNETMWHRRIDYPTSVNPNIYKDLSVRLFVTKVDKNLAKFETDLENVVHELKVVSKIDKTVESGDEPVDDIEITPMHELIDEYISCIPSITAEDLESTKKIAKSLYIGASNG